MQDVMSNSFRRRLIRAMLQDPAVLAEARRFIHPDDFADGRERSLVTLVLDHWDRHREPLDRQAFEERASEIGLDEEAADEVADEFYQSPGQTAFVRDRVIDFARKRRLGAALEQAASMLDSEAWDDILAVLRAAEAYGDTSDRRALIFPRDEDKLRPERDGMAVATGIELFDSVMRGGLPGGSLGLVVAPPNHGKSSLMISIAKQALLAGVSVAHFTLEMTIEQTYRRYKPVTRGPRRRSRAPLTVVGRASGSLTVQGIHEDIRQICQDGFRPGLIVVDYAALLRAPRQFDQKRHELAEIFKELRGLAQQLDVPVWTAHQSNRAGMESDYKSRRVIGIEDLAECFEIAAIVDVMLSINATNEERESDIARLFLAKNRLGPAHSQCLVHCDYEICEFTDRATTAGL